MIALYLPKMYCDMDMYGKIIRIGNSHGIIIPSALLKQLSLSAKDSVKICADKHTIYIVKEEPYTGPYTGPFADMPRPEPGEPDPWGEKTSEEIVEELRAGRFDRPKDLDW